MQTDQSTDSATVTTRRAFLTRTAVGGAVAAGALALPLSAIATRAGAQDGGIGILGDEDFVAFATPLELAAVQAYAIALTSQVLDDKWQGIALDFQSHHQAVADALIALGGDDSAAPEADEAFTKKSVDAINAGADQNAVLLALAEVEETLAATHLHSIGELIEVSTARTVTQVLAVEGQQAALLAVGAGTPVAEVTPPTSSDDAAITRPPASATTTTTTTAAN